ncbi:MAG: MBL fold metallo-hydrolase [Thermodesulfobacteriota bacterium]
MIVEQLTVGVMGVCCYVIGCPETGKGLIVDPGGDEDDVLAAVKKHGLAIELIVNTHGHPDHVCGNGVLRKKTGAAIAMHEADADFFARPDIVQYFSALGLPPSPPVDRRLADGDILEAGTVRLAVIHTPGHTPGGICLYSAPHLFTGDTLFAGGVGRTDFPGGSTSKLAAAIRERLFTLPDETIVWPGHGYGGSRSTIGREKRDNPFVGGTL